MPIARQAARTLPSSPAMAKTRRRKRYSRSSCVTATPPRCVTWSSARRMRRRSVSVGDVPQRRYISGIGHSDRKITALTGVGGSSRRSRLWVGMWLEGWSGCCWGEGDGEPQGVQLPDVVAGLLVLVDAAGVVAGAQVVVAGGGVGQQMPDDHQDGA